MPSIQKLITVLVQYFEFYEDFEKTAKKIKQVWNCISQLIFILCLFSYFNNILPHFKKYANSFSGVKLFALCFLKTYFSAELNFKQKKAVWCGLRGLNNQQVLHYVQQFILKSLPLYHDFINGRCRYSFYSEYTFILLKTKIS